MARYRPVEAVDATVEEEVEPDTAEAPAHDVEGREGLEALEEIVAAGRARRGVRHDPPGPRRPRLRSHPASRLAPADRRGDRFQRGDPARGAARDPAQCDAREVAMKPAELTRYPDSGGVALKCGPRPRSAPARHNPRSQNPLITPKAITKPKTRGRFSHRKGNAVIAPGIEDGRQTAIPRRAQGKPTQHPVRSRSSPGLARCGAPVTKSAGRAAAVLSAAM